MWIRSQDRTTFIDANVLTLELQTDDQKYVISAYAGDGSVESAFTVGEYDQEHQAQDVLQRFAIHLQTGMTGAFQV